MKTRHRRSHSRLWSQLGSVRLLGVVLLSAVGLLAMGGHSIFTAITNRTPTVVSYQECLKKRPKAAWLKVTNCELDVLHACWLTILGDKRVERETYYIPLREAHSPNGQSCILLKTSDPEIRKVIIEVSEMNSKSDAAFKRWVVQNLPRIFRREDPQGMVMTDEDIKSTERQELAKVQTNLAEDFIILDAGAKPTYAAGAVMVVIGLGLLGVLGFGAVQKA